MGTNFTQVTSLHFYSRYIYCGQISLSSLPLTTIFDILIAADELILDELVEYIQCYLLNYHKESMKQNFTTLYEKVFDYDSFNQLHDFFTEVASNDPTAI